MPTRRKATLRGKYWRQHFKSFRHCYYCGDKLVQRFIPEEGQKRLVCLKCNRITYLNPKVVAGLIPVLPDGRVVLGKRDIEPAKGYWSFPAGYQELGESVKEAAARETWEEVGIKARVTKLVGVYSYPDAGVVTLVYEGKVLRGEKPIAGHEVQEVMCCKPHQIPIKKLAFRSTVEAIKDWKKK